MNKHTEADKLQINQEKNILNFTSNFRKAIKAVNNFCL